MKTKNVVETLIKNRATLKTDRSHLKDEKNRIISTPLDDIDPLIIARYVSVALTDVEHLVSELKAEQFDIPLQKFTLKHYHIYSKKALMKKLNNDVTNKYLTVPSVANDSIDTSTSRCLFSNDSFDVHDLVSTEIPHVEHSRYDYFLVDNLDNVTPRISVAYALYILTSMIDVLTRHIHFAKSSAGKAKGKALSLLKTAIHCHSDKVDKHIWQKLFSFPYTTQLGQASMTVATSKQFTKANNHSNNHATVVDLLKRIINYLNKVLRTI